MKEDGWEKTFGNKGYVYSIDYGDVFPDLSPYLSPNLSSCIH